MSLTNEAFSRAIIDALLRGQGWNIGNTVSVRFEYALPDGSRSTRPVTSIWSSATNATAASTASGARGGYLVPYHIYKALTVKTAAEGGFEVRREELDWSAMDADTRAEFEKLFGDQATLTVDPSALERLFTIPERNRAIVREFRQVLEQGYCDYKGVLRNLVSVNMLDTGFDCPEVVNLVFARFTRSSILYQQMRGRGTRRSAGKPSFTLFDFVGVCDYHGDADEAGEGGAVRDAPKKRQIYEPRRLLTLDVDVRVFGGEDRLDTLLVDLNRAVFPNPEGNGPAPWTGGSAERPVMH